MAIDTSKLGNFVAEAMDLLEAQNHDAELGDILLICELRGGQEDEDTEGWTTVRFACSDPRAHVQIGLLRAAQLAAEDKGGP